MEKISKGNYAIPVSIVIAGVFIAGALYFALRTTTVPIQPIPVRPVAVDTTNKINPITTADHIRGNKNAKVFIVEYSDFECPFCKRFHGTLKTVMEKYGTTGDVAWVYRLFPLDSLHPIKARKEAVTAECVAQIGGNDAFWKFADRFFELTPSNNQTDIDTVLPKIISEIGLSQKAIDTCVSSGKYDVHVQDDIDNAKATGGQGTPWSIILGKNGDTLPLSGSQSLDTVQQMVSIMLKKQK